MPHSTPQKPTPWWLWQDETCPSCDGCSQSYAVHVAYYCIECDHPVCPICAVILREAGQIYCPACFKATHQTATPPQDAETLKVNTDGLSLMQPRVTSCLPAPSGKR